MNLMNGSLKGRLYEAESKKESLTEQDNRSYKVAFLDEHARDFLETTSDERNYTEAKRN